MQYETSILVEAPPPEVWAVLVAVERWAEWTPSIVRIQRLDGGPLGLGSTVRISRPSQPSLTWLIVEFDPERALTWTSLLPGATTTAHHHLERTPEGHTTVTLGIEQSGPLGSFAGRLTGRRTRSYVRMDAEGLKRRCEDTPNEDT